MRIRKKFVRATSFAMAAAMMLGMSLPAFAETYYLETGSITVTATEDGGRSVTQVGGVTNYVETQETVITQTDSATSTQNTVTIDATKGDVEVTLKDVNIDVSETRFQAAVEVKVSEGKEAVVELDGSNKLESGAYSAGLEISTESTGTLVIQDENDNAGSLEATGGEAGAGIGTGITVDESDDAVGEALNADIVINSGTVTGNGGYASAGIGTGYGGSLNGTITINDGTVTGNSKSEDQYGSTYGAGIGTGYAGELSGSININGGKVKGDSTSSNQGGSGAGIGTGQEATMSGKINISGGEVEGTADAGAGIGTGLAWYKTENNTTSSASINISGGTVAGKSSREGAGIGTGSRGTLNGSINITGGTVTGENNNTINSLSGAAIGTGQNGKINSTAAINISGSNTKVTAKTANSNNGAANIGTGYQGAFNGTIAIVDGASVKLINSGNQESPYIGSSNTATSGDGGNAAYAISTDTAITQNGQSASEESLMPQKGKDTHVHNVVKDNKQSSAPTCGADGTDVYKCTANGCTETYTVAIPATGEHVWNNGEVTTPATTTAVGVKTYTCNVCKTTKTETIAKLEQEENTGDNSGTAAAPTSPAAPSAADNGAGDSRENSDEDENTAATQTAPAAAGTVVASGAPIEVAAADGESASIVLNFECHDISAVLAGTGEAEPSHYTVTVANTTVIVISTDDTLLHEHTQFTGEHTQLQQLADVGYEYIVFESDGMSFRFSIADILNTCSGDTYTVNFENDTAVLRGAVSGELYGTKI